jgi:tRNA pseudouridine55 synthase
MPRRKKGRKISGVLLLDKACGVSSNYALQQIKRLYNAQKAGHTGSLDPLATGILPICLGEATKFSKYLLADNKTYIATIKLGINTTTLDSEGEITDSFNTKHITQELVINTLKSFIGKGQQVPPMFSALKKDGTPLYKLARQGVEIERKSRDIEIFSLKLLAFKSDEITIQTKVSKGTYIRSIAQDIGKKLNSGGHITALCRIEFTHFKIDNCLKFTDLEKLSSRELDAKLHKIEAIIPQFNKIKLTQKEFEEISFGRKIITQMENQTIKMFFMDNFVGIGEINNNLLQPKRLVSLDS